MRPISFLNCISYNGVFTGTSGSVVGIYDLNSGSGNGSFFYNNIYSTGYHKSGSSIYGPAIPLLNVGKSNISGYQFSGNNCYQLGYTNSGDFSILLDIEYSGCLRNTNNTAYVLFSTTNNPTGQTGTFFIGVNEVNRLFCQTSGYTKTLGKELHTNNIVYIGFGKSRYLEFGIFDVLNQEFVSESLTLNSELKDINTLWIGGFLNNSNILYTGYSGKIFNIVLNNKQFETSGINICSNCLFVTGQTTGTTNIETINLPVITGYLFSGINDIVITGFSQYTGTITKFDNSLLNIIFPSGKTGSIKVQEVATLLTGLSGIQLSGKTPIIFQNDTGKLNLFTTYNIEFDTQLESGDFVEIFTHQNWDSSIGLDLENLTFPESNRFVQIIGNGLVETNNVDYFLVRNQISGFNNEDILLYDLLTGSSLVTPFSGYWADDKILMSGGIYFPPNAQFNEVNDIIAISGISGHLFDNFNYDVYINGQKLESGFSYNFVYDENALDFGGITGLRVLEILPPPYVPNLIVNLLYSPTGGLPTGVESVEDSELTLVPRSNNLITNYKFQITSGVVYIENITGFSEQIWLNGIRQTEDIDYVKNFKCTSQSGIIDIPNLTFNFYNNESGFFNVE